MKIDDIEIKPGQNKQIKLDIARLPSGTKIEIPVFVNRGKKPGPTLLVMAGLHGDEINSVDVVRTFLQEKKSSLDSGTLICIPVLNIFGFINYSREVPDGKDVNRSFPGSAKGSLASLMAYHLTQKILPHCDYIIDLHTGGASRFNHPQVRGVLTDETTKELAMAFNAPLTLHSGLIAKSIRQTAFNQGKTIIVYEGGESLRFDDFAKKIALQGIENVMVYLGMKSGELAKPTTKVFNKKRWLRAPSSGLFNPLIQAGEEIKKGQVIGFINGPFADYHKACKAPKSGTVITLNNNPMVNRGDAIVQMAYNI